VKEFIEGFINNKLKLLRNDFLKRFDKPTAKT